MFKLLILLWFLNFGDAPTSCEDLPTYYYSYARALSTVKNTSFSFDDAANTTGSSWVRALHYYSCDYQTGYLIMRTDKKEYLHNRVPMKIWKQLKNTQSKGEFYNQFIRHRYALNLR